MPLPVIADVARVALLGDRNAAGTNTVNVIHVERADSGTSWEDVATNVRQKLAAGDMVEMWGANTSGWTLQAFHLTPLDGATNTIEVLRGANDWPVGQTGGGTIPQACALVKLTTAQRGRRGRGRLYLGPIGESGQADGVLNGTIQGQVSAAWDAFANALIGDTNSAAVGVASYKYRDWHQATTIACESMTATQRRRQKR